MEKKMEMDAEIMHDGEGLKYAKLPRTTSGQTHTASLIQLQS